MPEAGPRAEGLGSRRHHVGTPPSGSSGYPSGRLPGSLPVHRAA